VLAALEREVGMRLTERAGRGLELTAAALILVGHTDALLARLETAESDLAALRDQVAGRVTLAPRDTTSCAEMIQRACARAGFVPRVVARATDFGVLLSLVAASAGVTLVPELAARRLPPQVRLLRPAEPVTRQIFTVSRRSGDRKPAVRVVLDALAAEAARSSADAATAA
jgi:DNA-binding transcriptional LysR family regulator